MNDPQPAPDAAPIPSHGHFEDLIKAEALALGIPPDEAGPSTVTTPGKAGEPWVASTTQDSVGLALSGGGVRSATFNLGLLQALHKKKLLTRVDYLSTVSGGGYLGAFWTRWRRHHRFENPTDRAFPQATGGADGKAKAEPPEIREAAEIRHLREYSRFLIPRQGLNPESLKAVGKVLEGVIPSLTATFSVVLLLTVLWAWLAWGVTALLGHIPYLQFGPAGRPSLGLPAGDAPVYAFNYLLVIPCVLLAALLVGWIFGQLIGRRFSQTGETQNGFMTWVLGLFIFWALFTGIWEIGVWLKAKAALAPDRMFGQTGGVMAVLAMLFVWLRRWIEKAPWKEGPIGWRERLKPYIPKLLAYALVGFMFVLAAVFILEHGFVKNLRPSVGMTLTPALILVLVLFFFDPSQVGLHVFYRSQLVNCYLKASRMNAPAPTCPEETEDDMPLSKDDGKPIHLICCAANHLKGDLIDTLHRGARSAVLSRHGIAIGDRWVRDEALRLSSAITASAAALNSMMGDKSMALGPAVTFVMTAFSMRLGLWVQNPGRETSGCLTNLFPGSLFVKELLGWSRTGATDASHVHLSDGGHFENLAIYELIRRHCRYIIVSDAGQDSDFTFADFGRAVRRVREDFGVEIEIDFAPLRPGPDGLSRQHVAVGSIHYDGMAGTDKGTLVYLKPTLSGDEPVDLFEYHCANAAFPHDTTLDQFFDEAQWESYRRLGEHAGNAGLCMIGDADQDASTERLFRQIRLYWHRTPWTKGDAGIRLCDHKEALEKWMLEQSPKLMREFFGIPGVFGQKTPDLPAESEIVATRVEIPEIPEIVDPLMGHRIFTFLEEAWFICELDRYWSHPLANAWMAYLHRLAAMPSVRCWWPVLKSMYGQDFQEFADTRLHLMTGEGFSPWVVIEDKGPESPFVHGYASRRFRELGHVFTPSTHQIQLNMVLGVPESPDRAGFYIQVGLAVIQITGVEAAWDSPDLFIPPELRGGGLTTQLLKGVIRYLETELPVPITRMEVILMNEGKKPEIPLSSRGPAERQWIIELIDFYKSFGFRFKKAWSHGEQPCLVRYK